MIRQTSRRLVVAIRFGGDVRSYLLCSSAFLGGIGSLILPVAPAAAAQECGAPIGGVVTCTAAGNPYPGGISYTGATDLHVITETDVTALGTVNARGGGLLHVTHNGSVATIGSGTALLPGEAGVSVVSSGSALADGKGSVATSGNYAPGIQAIGMTDATVTVSGAVATSGTGSKGIYTYAYTGNARINAVNVKTTGDNAAGAYAYAAGAGNAIVTTTGTVSTSGAGSAGIYASSAGGGTMVDVNNVTTAGSDAPGVYSSAGNGNAAVRVSGSVQTTGDRSTGIYAGASGGSASVNATSVTTRGADATGVYAVADGGNAIVTTTGTVATSGPRSLGIYAYATGGSATVNAVNVTTAGDDSTAVAATAVGGNAVAATTGTVSTTGARAVGLYSYATGGTAAVQAVKVTTAGANADGIVAIGGTGATVTAGQVATTGARSSAILALAATGGVTVTSGSAVAAGAGGVGIGAAGTGAVTITSGTASARDQPAIAALSTAGPVSVTVTGPTTSAQGQAITIRGGTTAALTVGAGGTVSGGAGGALLASATGTSVANAGTIASGTGYALTITGGAGSIANSGTIDGRVFLFTGGGSTLVNSGRFNARADSTFGGTADIFRNSGTLAVLPGTAAGGTVAFTGLESFANSGTVSLLNGHSGDIFILPGSFAGSAGSTLSLDLAGGPAAPTIDRLTVAGAITGSTILIPNGLAANGGLLNPGIVFATGGSGSSAGAFGLAGGTQTVGFIRYSVLSSTSGTTTSYALVGGPGDAVFRLLKLNEGMQSIWYKSADAWSAHMAGVRDAKWNGASGASPSGGIWGQSYGEADLRKSSQTTSAFGVSRTIGTSYKQDVFGGQIGADLSSGGPGGAVTFGVTGGYVNSELGFRSSSDRARYNVVNAGAYASFVGGPIFVNVLAKYDYAWVFERGAQGAYADKFHGQSYGAQGELGVRLGSNAFYAEPVVSAAYVRTDLGSIHALGSTIDFDNLNGLRGKAGLRLGSSRVLAGGAKLVVYVGGNVVHEFEGKDGLTFLSGANSLGLRNDRIPTYGEGKLGLNVVSVSGVSGFIEGVGNYSHDYKGGGGRVGLTIKL